MKTRFRLLSGWLALSVTLGLTLGACAQTRGYQPLANPQADPRAAGSISPFQIWSTWGK